MIHFQCYMKLELAKQSGLQVVMRSQWKLGYTNAAMVFFHSTNFRLRKGILLSVLDPRYAKEFVIDSDEEHIGKLIWAFPEGAEKKAAKGFGVPTICRYYFKVPAGAEFYATGPVAAKGAPAKTEVGFPYIVEQEDIIWKDSWGWRE